MTTHKREQIEDRPIRIDAVYDLAWNQIKGRRSSQQDSVASVSYGMMNHLCVLAYGMGGRAGGDVASALAVSTFRRTYERPGFSRGIRTRLRAAAESVNHAIRHQVAAVPELAGMGTMITAIAIYGTQLYWISVGDSPLWLIRRGGLHLLNAERVDSSSVPRRGRDKVRLPPGRKSLAFDALTGERQLELKVSSTGEALFLGDVLLIESDGIETCGDDELVQIVRSCQESAKKTVEGILAAIEARDYEFRDNATVIAVRVTR